MSGAMVSLYSLPNEAMLRESSGALYACSYLGQNDLCIISLSDILSVVSMQPLPPHPLDPPNLWFLVEKTGLDMMEIDMMEDPEGMDDNE